MTLVREVGERLRVAQQVAQAHTPVRELIAKRAQILESAAHVALASLPYRRELRHGAPVSCNNEALAFLHLLQ
jgi:hypothetical protein